MPHHLKKEIENLKLRMSELCAKVEKAMNLAVRCSLNHDKEMAARIVEGDAQIDADELRIEEECLKILALHQPVAVDLRYVIACLKMNNDLERIGDLSANIANNVLEVPAIEELRNFESVRLAKMLEAARKMLRNSLNALFTFDESLARNVLESDDFIDDLNKSMHVEVAKRIKKSPELTEALLRILVTSRNIERIADYATNIAEDTIYLITGEIVRHAGSA